ncbi:MAG: alpha/beta hydrolase [Lacipirellulaceae bacterium]
MSKDDSQPIPLIIFSGLAADAEIVRPQLEAFPQASCPEWLVPENDETLEAYCERFAQKIDTGEPCLLAGISFGGIVAQHCAKHLDARGVVLIATVRDPGELPRRVRVFRPLVGSIRFVPLAPFRLLSRGAAMLGSWAPLVSAIAKQFIKVDAQVVRWSLRKVLQWKNSLKVPCPVYQIHGKRDWVFPVGLTQPDEIIPSARHVITLSHPEEVNDFLRAIVEKHSHN